MDADLNAYQNLGFVATVDRNERPVRLLQKSDSTWNEVFIQEPWRDSNKLYTGARGLPLGEAHPSDPEDFGVTQSEIVIPSIMNKPCVEELSSLRHFLGGAWVGTPSLTAEGNSWPITDASRVGAAVHDLDGWQFIFFKLGDVFPNRMWDKHSLFEVLNQTLTTADLILPLLEPQRVTTPKGVVFFG